MLPENLTVLKVIIVKPFIIKKMYTFGELSISALNLQSLVYAYCLYIKSLVMIKNQIS